MIYEISTPDARLAPYIKYFWYMHDSLGNQAGHKDLLIPDGNLEWVLNDSSEYMRSSIGESDVLVINSSVLVGQRNRSIVASRTRGTRLAGIKFLPGAFFLLTGHEESEFRNQCISSDIILRDWQNELQDKVFSAPSIQHCFEEMNRFFLSRYKLASGKELILMRNIIQYINRHADYPQLSEIHDFFNIHKKRLERIFSKYVGLSPKNYIKTMRFKKAYKRFNRGEDEFYNKSFYGMGYYDQMHFIKDFKSFVGHPPTEYYKGTSTTTDEILLETLKKLRS